jgi:hypothetical protein
VDRSSLVDKSRSRQQDVPDFYFRGYGTAPTEEEKMPGAPGNQCLQEHYRIGSADDRTDERYRFSIVAGPDVKAACEQRMRAVRRETHRPHQPVEIAGGTHQNRKATHIRRSFPFDGFDDGIVV